MGKTRAGQAGNMTTSTIATQGFGVFAYNTGSATLSDATTFATYKPDFMYNQKVTSGDAGSTWSYTPLKYWPNGIDAGNSANSNSPSVTATESGIQYLSFFAYGPYTDKVTVSATDYNLKPTAGTFHDGSDNEYVTAVSNEAFGILSLTSNGTAGDPKITYRFKYDSGNSKYDISETNNVDLLWGLRNDNSYDEADGTDNTAATNYNINLTKQTTTEKVNFLFKHALAKIGGYTGSASGIKVVADFDANETTNPTAQGSGSIDSKTVITLNSITIANGGSGSSTFAINGIFDLATGTWDTSASTKGVFSNEYTKSTANINSDVWETATPVWSTDKWAWTGSTATPGVTQSMKNVFSGSTDALYFIPTSTGQSLKITVQYTVRTYDTNLPQETGGSTCSKVTQTITNDVDISALTSNHYYTLIIHLGMTSVKFAASVADWETTTGGTADNKLIWLPSNVVGS